MRLGMATLKDTRKMSGIAFGRFVGAGEFADALVLKDGVKVGLITRVKSDEFVTESSRQRRWVVTEYEVALYADEDSVTFTTAGCGAVEALKRAKDYCREKCRIGETPGFRSTSKS